MLKRLTREEIIRRYPNQYVGVKEPEYVDNDGITLKSGIIVFTDKTEDELFDIQINTSGEIISYFTGESSLTIGVTC